MESTSTGPREYVFDYDWIVVRSTQSVTDNQHPNGPSPVALKWVEAGWEIVSVTPISTSAESISIVSTVVLRKAKSAKIDPSVRRV